MVARANGTTTWARPAGGDHRRVLAQLLPQPPDDPLDLPGEPVGDAAADGLDGRLADQRPRLQELHLGELGRPLVERVERDLRTGGDDAAQVLAVVRDRVVGDGGAEVHDDAGAAEPREGGDGVDEAVGADLARVVDPDRHSGADRGPDVEHLVIEVQARHRRPLLRELGHGGGDDRAVDVGEAQPPQAEQVGQDGAQLVAGRLAHGGKAPVLGDDVLAVAVDAEVRLGVADVDDEEHGGQLQQRRRDAADRLGPSSPSSARVSASRCPEGRVRSGSSSSRGTSTKRREPVSACGRVSRSELYSRSPSSSTSTSITRGPWRGPPAARPTSRSTALQASSRSSGPSAVSIRTQALRKSGWSSTRPTGAVSYSDEQASTRTPWAGSAAMAAARCALRVADVGAEAQVSGGRHGARGRAAQPWASRHTSTDTSVTGSASGGSGLAALTHTAWASYWSSSRSAIAAHRRSSVL